MRAQAQAQMRNACGAHVCDHGTITIGGGFGSSTLAPALCCPFLSVLSSQPIRPSWHSALSHNSPVARADMDAHIRQSIAFLFASSRDQPQRTRFFSLSLCLLFLLPQLFLRFACAVAIKRTLLSF
jgi:hypothetical protein